MAILQLSCRDPKLHKEFLKQFIPKVILDMKEVRILRPDFLKEDDFLFSFQLMERDHYVYFGSINGYLLIAALPYGRIELEHTLSNVIKVKYKSLSGTITYEKYVELIKDMKFEYIEELLLDLLNKKEEKEND